MPKAGEVRVILPISDAIVIGAWLKNTYAIKCPHDAAAALECAARLTKAVRRRQIRTTIPWILPKRQAQWFAELTLRTWFAAPDSSDFIHVPIPDTLRQAGEHFASALSRRGRPKLSGTQLERALLRDFVDVRFRKRLQRRLRFEKAMEAFDEEGLTVLGSPEKVPRF